MKKLLIGASALLATVTGVVAGATPAQAAWGGHGGGFHGGYGGYHGGGYHGGYAYRGGYGHWGYRGGWRGGDGWAWGLGGLATGLAVGAALAPSYYYGPPPGYYVGPDYYAYYGGCHHEWVWTGYGYRVVRACY